MKITTQSSFDYYRPRSLNEAVACLLEAGPRAAVMAGGTDLVPRLKRRQRNLDVVVDLSGIGDLRAVEPTERGLVIGALSTPRELSTSKTIRRSFPALHEASRAIGAVQIRATSTLGGAIASRLGRNAEWFGSVIVW